MLDDASLKSNVFGNGYPVRYFGYGRTALYEALRLLGLGRTDSVLIPAYICREVLAPINAVGARPVFYDVAPSFSPLRSWKEWPVAKAVLAVNYFGIPQPLEQFEKYCSHYGAILIEDNAHGFLSKADDGRLLGFRGDMGIFSMRKSISMADGAALVVRHAELILRLSPQLASTKSVRTPAAAIHEIRGKARLTASFAIAKKARRIWRRWNTGFDMPLSTVEDELNMPAVSAPHADLFRTLNSIDPSMEIARRRELFFRVNELVTQFDHESEPNF